MVACGLWIGGDVSHIRVKGVKIGRVVEIENLDRRMFSNLTSAKLKDLCRVVLKLNMADKNIGQDYDYKKMPLPD
jgi:hypothetical protein